MLRIRFSTFSPFRKISLRSAFGVECERDLYLGKHRDQQRFVHVPVLYGAVPQAVQRYGPVHRSGVDEYVADPRGDLSFAKVLLPHDEKPSIAITIF